MCGTVKPSEPLWALANDEGELYYWTLHHNEQCGVTLQDVPCRVIPGHGKVVPVELVEAIQQAMTAKHGSAREAVAGVQAAIDAALEGAV